MGYDMRFIWIDWLVERDWIDKIDKIASVNDGFNAEGSMFLFYNVEIVTYIIQI
jgi:hypothetical protein